MSRRIYALAVLSCATLALGACSSARLGGAPIRSAAAAPAMTPAPVEPMPSAPIETAPLAPVESQPLPPVGGAPVAPGGTDIAALPPQTTTPIPPAPAAPAGPATRTSLVGAWTAQVTGSACRVQLSSTPALDLYRASSTGCANQDLSRINAWDYRNGEVYLYQTGGAVVARVRGSSGSLSGALTKSGGPISLAR